MSLLLYLKYKRGGLTGGKKRGVYFVRKNWMRKTNPKNWPRADATFKKQTPRRHKSDPRSAFEICFSVRLCQVRTVFLSALSLFFRFLIGLIVWNGHTLHLRAAIKWNGRKYGQCNQLKHIWPPSWWLVLERCQVHHCIICICYYRKQQAFIWLISENFDCFKMVN